MAILDVRLNLFFGEDMEGLGLDMGLGTLPLEESGGDSVTLALAQQEFPEGFG